MWKPIPIQKIDFDKFPTNEELISVAFHATASNGFYHPGEIYFFDDETRKQIPESNAETFEECHFLMNTELFSSGFIDFSGSWVCHEAVAALMECWRDYTDNIRPDKVHKRGIRSRRMETMKRRTQKLNGDVQ